MNGPGEHKVQQYIPKMAICSRTKKVFSKIWVIKSLAYELRNLFNTTNY